MTEIERALDCDRTTIESLLLAGGLPLDGLDIALPAFFVARGDGGVVGCAGFERYGSDRDRRGVVSSIGL
jgi:hypothetical protein